MNKTNNTKLNNNSAIIDPQTDLKPPGSLADINPEDIKTMNLHQLGELIGRLEREIPQPTENQVDPTRKLAGNQWEIPENAGNSRSFSDLVERGSCRDSSSDHPSTNPTDTSPASIPNETPPIANPLRYRHSILLALNKEDHAFVLDLLETHTLEQTKTRLANPRPYGLGIRVSVSALQRFGSNNRMAEIFTHQETALEEAGIVLENATEMDDTQFVLAAKHLLKLRLVRTAISPRSPTAELRSLFQILDRLRQTDLAERRLVLAEKNAAKQNPSEGSAS